MKEKELENYTDENGEIYTFLYPDGISKLQKVYVKEMIWSAFNGDVPQGMKVTHIDGNKANNALKNLKLEQVA